jgi:hypothetical protein
MVGTNVAASVGGSLVLVGAGVTGIVVGPGPEVTAKTVGSTLGAGEGAPVGEADARAMDGASEGREVHPVGAPGSGLEEPRTQRTISKVRR